MLEALVSVDHRFLCEQIGTARGSGVGGANHRAERRSRENEKINSASSCEYLEHRIQSSISAAAPGGK
jgi:hypothetical protein